MKCHTFYKQKERIDEQGENACIQLSFFCTTNDLIYYNNGVVCFSTNAPVTLSTFIHSVIFFTGHLVVAPGKCEFTTLIKFKHKKVEFPVF